MFRQRFLEYDFSKKTIFFESRTGFCHCKMGLSLILSLREKDTGQLYVIAKSSCLYSVIARSDSDVAISSP